MINPLQGLGDLKKLRDTQQMLKKMAEEVKVEVNKHNVRVVMTGDQKIQELESNGQPDNDIKEAVNEAFKKSQEAMAKKMMQSGEMGGLGGLFGK